MANGITFYKNKHYEGFDNSEETVGFTILINDMFDALNRKFPAEGIRKSSKDLEVFQKYLMFLFCCMVLCFVNNCWGSISIIYLV